VSKYLIRTTGGFYICNKNLAFGLTFLEVFAIIILFILVFFIFNLKFKILNLKLISNSKFKISNLDIIHRIIFALIISGGLSNIIDRIYFGCVIDFINLHFWPVFNFADIYITIGVLIFFKIVYFKK
jgi:signal peptidase II